VSIAGELAMYLPVPLFGMLCDRTSPALLAGIAALLFAPGYGLAAAVYAHAWGVGWMILAFVLVGAGTASMYISAVTTSAKNFGRGRFRGIAIALPIAAFGLSGMWESQVGSRFLYELNPDGTPGELDVVKYFIFLAILLGVVGILGVVGLRIVDEEEMIAEAVEELERSGFLPPQSQTYGTVPADPEQQLLQEQATYLSRGTLSRSGSFTSASAQKRILLNAETHRFLTDPTMWRLAMGFFLLAGPGEGFVNNMGTILIASSPPNMDYPKEAAMQLSIIAAASTAFRLLMGSVTDLLAPSPDKTRRFTLSRVPVLIVASLLLLIGFALLAIDPDIPFGVVSVLVGAGYGGTFALVPIIISVVWGVENFATNWGIVATVPAVGATVWGVIYAAIYQKALSESARQTGDEKLCYGHECYSTTAAAMAVSVACAIAAFSTAWMRWKQRGVVV
jgi:MFS family permease